MKPIKLKKEPKLKMESDTKTKPGARPKAKAKAPPTEAELSLSAISQLVKASASVSSQAKSFMNQLEALKKIYPEKDIEEKILDFLTLALDLRGIKIGEDSLLEVVIASNESLKELWMGEVYMDASEEAAVKRLTIDLTKLGEVMKTKSYRSYLKTAP